MSKNNSYAVIGMGRFGTAVAMELANSGADVLAVDINEERVRAISEHVTCAVKADISDAETVASLGLGNMDAVVVAMTRSMDASILATISAKESGAKYVIAKAQNEMHAKILTKVGADKVIVPEKESGRRIAKNLVNGNFLDFFELSDRISMVEIPVQEEWIGFNLRELDFRRKYSVNVIAYEANGKDLIVNIPPDMPLDKGTIWITGMVEDVSRVMKKS
ncbi:MAG: TrkA family potassium uptake protein [Lachnospiraceae bacterium]|nr:TrkA family potassium uptake protein [Lachnospiraceae bacterium]MBR3762759.1 TrkA family potassium uptake protein [Lachnospiraceae bacterium]